MSSPRLVSPKPLFITRRTACRFYLFRPDREITQAFLYCLGVAAGKFGIVVHAATLMSTHYHLVVSDPRGVHPLFTQYLNVTFAQVTQALRGWGHQVFSSAKPSVVRLHGNGAVIDKTAYTIANPVACGAVKSHRDWPGFVSRVEDIGRLRMTLERPERFFSKDGQMPESVEVTFELPSSLVEEHGEAGARRALSKNLAAKEKMARAKIRARGIKFLGKHRVRKASPFRRAKSHEVFGALNPRWATVGGGKEAYLRAAEEYREFQAAYREAWDRWVTGDRDVVFPYGTWLMRVLHGVRCAPPPQ